MAVPGYSSSDQAAPPQRQRQEPMTDNDDIPMDGAIKDKLIEAKQVWARDGRLLTGTTADPTRDRLPPGQRLVRDWPVLDLGVQPNVTEGEFRLDVDGLVENP